jgi:2-phospho-L-lactate guanylyltransferase (CobY/MobA/RfbA family)
MTDKPNPFRMGDLLYQLPIYVPKDKHESIKDISKLNKNKRHLVIDVSRCCGTNFVILKEGQFLSCRFRKELINLPEADDI